MIVTMATPLFANVISVLLLLNLVMAAGFMALLFAKKTIFSESGFPILLKAYF